MDVLQAINDALYKDRATFQAFLTDTLQATKTTANVYELPDGGTVTFREGWIDIRLADGRRLVGNLNTETAPEEMKPPDIIATVFDTLFNGTLIQNLPREHIEALLERRNTTLTRKMPTGEAIRIHIGDKGIITAMRLYPDGTQERAGYWLPQGLSDLGEEATFTATCMEQCLLHAPRRRDGGRGR